MPFLDRRSSVLGALTVLGLVASCHRPSGAGSDPGLGSAQFALTVPGVQVDVVHWSISQGTPAVAVKMGDHIVAQSGPSASFLVTGLSPGPYVITLSANGVPNPVQPDPVACTGSAMFTVAPGTTTHATVLLVCKQTPTRGGVVIDGKVSFEDCPYVTSYVVSSTQPGIGGIVDVTATAADRDPTLALAYHWSASAPAGAPIGTFAAPASPTTQFTCPAGYDGEQTVTIFVTNDVSKNPSECPLARQSIQVLCVPVSCGDGVVQSALGEACDRGLSASGARLNGPGTGCTYSCQKESAAAFDAGVGPADAAPALDAGGGDGGGIVFGDAPSGETLGGDGAGGSGGTDGGGGAGSNPIDTCLQCRESRRGQPAPNGCQALMGCENLPEPDHFLCKDLLYCMYSNPTCWADTPATCYCGTAQGLDCTIAPNGVCRDQALAAAKVAPTDYTNGSIRFFNLNFPSGHATQEIACSLKCFNAGECTGASGGFDGGSGADGGDAAMSIDLCGNGQLDPGETCDDGNKMGGDGCNSLCQLECGNGSVDATGEQCDDGNRVDGDGCNHLCQWEPQPTCSACREARRYSGTPATGGCNASMGCESLTDPTDRQLCQSFLACMYAHPTCWATRPSDCLCGTAQGLDCTTVPNGPCLAEALAAAKVPPTDYTNASIRYFNTNFPSGHATQEIVCDTKCVAAGNTCP